MRLLTGKFMKRLSVLALVVVAALVVAFDASGAASDRARAYVADGRKMFAAGDLKAAIIQLRNAVQTDPANGEARYMLGLAYYRSGDWPSAEQNLRGAAERGYDHDAVDAALGDALLKQEK